MEPTWEDIIKEIDTYIITYFQKIEWYYGDNRAPFAYPARCYKEHTATALPLYVCELVMEDPGATNIKITAEAPTLLFSEVKKTINSHFSSFEDDIY